jgi:hypothetical protein
MTSGTFRPVSSRFERRFLNPAYTIDLTLVGIRAQRPNSSFPDVPIQPQSASERGPLSFHVTGYIEQIVRRKRIKATVGGINHGINENWALQTFGKHQKLAEFMPVLAHQAVSEAKIGSFPSRVGQKTPKVLNYLLVVCIHTNFLDSLFRRAVQGN